LRDRAWRPTEYSPGLHCEAAEHGAAHAVAAVALERAEGASRNGAGLQPVFAEELASAVETTLHDVFRHVEAVAAAIQTYFGTI
jgi:hypothetical protein